MAIDLATVPGGLGVAARTTCRVAVADARDAAAWDTFVSRQPDATGYHDWAWRDVFPQAFGHKSVYLIARTGEAVAGVLPLVDVRSILFGRSLSSLPFLNYGGVLAVDDSTARALVDEACVLAKACGARHVELRHVARRFPDLPARQHKVTMHLPLSPGMWERFDRKLRNQIRKAEKSGLTTTEGHLELLPAFYAVFARNMRDLGTPVYARRFFERILKTFPDRTRVVVVWRGDVPVAAGVTFRTRRVTEVPWASSRRAFNALCPNHLLYWRVVESAMAAGCDTLDFGRSTPGEGTFNFKKSWGAEPVALHWEYPYLATGAVPDQGPTNPKFQAAIALWKRCPLWLANGLGPHIVRGIP